MEPAVVISGFMGMADEKEAIRQFCGRICPTRTAERRGDWRDSGSHALAYGGCVSSFLSRYREGTDESPVLRNKWICWCRISADGIQPGMAGRYVVSVFAVKISREYEKPGSLRDRAFPMYSGHAIGK